MYWRKNDDDKPSKSETASADIETTSYILLAKFINYSKNDLASLPAIAKWINSQRNSLGGFYSTQVSYILKFSKITVVCFKNLFLT
jgi:hypothetical protein